MNRAVPHCNSDLLLFTDVDARLAPDSLHAMVGHYADDRVGGICGRRIIGENQETLRTGQDHHFRFHANLQLLESRIGSVTANEGKLYTMRRHLYRPIAPAVTDDLFTCLSVVQLGYRFLFEPAAVAYVHLPSRSLTHEITRRRRIVSTSLRGIWHHRSLLNPFRHGAFATGLFINKILRRLLPLLLILLFASNLFLVGHPVFAVALAVQMAFYLSLPAHTACRWLRLRPPVVGDALSTAAYFVAGNAGMLLGLLDFCRGRVVDRWDPHKADH